MFWSENRGYSRGGLDVVTAVNLFFKGVLLFPVFLLAIYIGATMMKHMFFHGIPVMNKPTEQQQELLRNADSQIGVPQSVPSEETQTPSDVISPEGEVGEEPLEEAPVIEAKEVEGVKIRKYREGQWQYDACSQWAAANPRLAERLKPGESCYGF